MVVTYNSSHLNRYFCVLFGVLEQRVVCSLFLSDLFYSKWNLKEASDVCDDVFFNLRGSITFRNFDRPSKVTLGCARHNHRHNNNNNCTIEANKQINKQGTCVSTWFEIDLRDLWWLSKHWMQASRLQSVFSNFFVVKTSNSRINLLNRTLRSDRQILLIGKIRQIFL